MVKLDRKDLEQYTSFILQALRDEEKAKFRNNFLSLHPSDQADVFVTLNKDVRVKAYDYLESQEFARVFDRLDIHKQKLYFQELADPYAYEIFNYMFTDDVVQFIKGLDPTLAEKILYEMDQEKAKEVGAILSYAMETAGSIMTKELISISPNETAAQIIDQLREKATEAESIYYNYVVDKDGSLVGVVSLRDLITAQPETMIRDIMRKKVVSVPEDLDQEDVGGVIKKYDLLAVPVVSKHNHLLGIVTVDDVMDILESETTEDFGEISATKGATDINLSALTAAKKRSPWIIALMFFGLITGGVIGQFEDTLEQVVVLAAFIPMIMDSGGNVGTQSLAVAVRGLALGTIEKNSFWRMVRREFSTGAMIGAICMVLITLMIAIFYGNWMLGLIVGVSILCTLSVSAVIGAIVPLLINKLKIDPAVASGPFITTLNDIIGLMIYFSIATALLDAL
ncbi:magnesium transporter [Virgibacillus halotolerans]|uniref:magnesium transporter n=1 Tax=Virgibacillus halotolerans TaxID=1071053 RepID=UPI001960D256|nr:magnesium transporter [Virgibacillus halotolerans]